MGRLIITSFTNLDGVVEDPDASAVRRSVDGPCATIRRPSPGTGSVSARSSNMGRCCSGRRTWDHFRNLWPRSDDPLSLAMNVATEVVVTPRPVDEAGWVNSRAIDAPLDQRERCEIDSTDIVVIGSMLVAGNLAGQGLVDDYRLLTSPTLLGAGRGLFRGRHELRLTSSEQVSSAMRAALAPEPEDRS